MSDDEDPIIHESANAEGERLLWGAVLKLFCDDAWLHARHGFKGYEAVFAYNDLMECGTSTRYLCNLIGIDPEEFSERFRLKVASNPRPDTQTIPKPRKSRARAVTLCRDVVQAPAVMAC